MKKNKTTREKVMKKTKIIVSLLTLALLGMVVSCSSSGGSDPGGGDPVSVTATVIAKAATTDVRDSYGLFSISANKAATDYRLGVAETAAGAPTASDMNSYGLKRNLSNTAINVLIAQRLNAPIVAFAQQYFAANTYQTLGAGMSFSGLNATTTPNSGYIYDNTATGSDAWVTESVLKPSTGYTLYGMENGGSTVTALATFTTDAHPDARAADDSWALTDTTLTNGNLTISVNADEYYIFPVQREYVSANTIDAGKYSFSKAAFVTMDVQTADMSVFGNNAPGGFEGTLLLVGNALTGNDERLLKGSFFLFATGIVATNSFQSGMTLDVGNLGILSLLETSTLTKQ